MSQNPTKQINYPSPGEWKHHGHQFIPLQYDGMTTRVACIGPDPGAVALVHADTELDEHASANERLVQAAPKLLAACQAVLLYHKGGIWSEEDGARWFELTGQTECNSKTLCDTLRERIAYVLNPESPE